MNFCAVPAKPAEVGCRLGCVGRVLPYAVVTPALPLRCDSGTIVAGRHQNLGTETRR